MGTQIKGGNNQVGTSNTQFIESTVITNSHVTLNINVNCTECLQHQHQEGISFSQGNEHHVIAGHQKLALTCGQPTRQIAAESETQAKCRQTIPVVKKRRVKLPEPEQQTRALPETIPAVPDSVRILDPRGQVLEPGDAVCIDCQIFSLYVGDGCVVWYQEQSRTVVKEKFDLTRPITKLKPKSYGTLDLYSPELRVQRALQQVGRECPVSGGHYLNFVCWTFTGLSYQQCLQGGFYLDSS